MRLPGGSLNAQADPRVLREILTGLSRDGYTVFDWTVTSGDDGGEGQPVPLAPEEIARKMDVSLKDLDILLSAP